MKNQEYIKRLEQIKIDIDSVITAISGQHMNNHIDYYISKLKYTTSKLKHLSNTDE